MFLSFTLGSLYLIFQHRRAILKGIVLPFILYTLLQLVRYGLVYSGYYIDDASLFLHVFYIFADIAIVTIVSLNTMRIVLLNENPTLFKLKPARRDVKFFLYSVGFLALWIVPGLFIGASLPLMMYSAFMGVIPLTFFLIGLFFTLRLSLLFVGVALDRDISMRESFDMTRSSQWSLFFTLALLVTLLFVFHYSVEVLISSTGSDVFGLLSFFLITPLVDMFVYVFTAIVLTILYSNAYQPAVGSQVGHPRDAR
ncbi:hypothetical protein IEI94_13215 [Halomonas sp. ML-15]|uniref:hypothetical protein n=1 Tax=Halomonas sp. ML-15 TaxID=2773305 RepID=UPI0017460329|nr:hypothetical protein [Halomonas sp. ML-15]MBD3896814.1 hypothetical protein [Halomonas sp. ML-15]